MVAELVAFLPELHHILHARSCNHLQSFPHTPKPPHRPLTLPKNFNLLFTFPNTYFFGLLFKVHLGYGHTLPCRGHKYV